MNPGERLAHYTIVGPLGAGGMGVVYRAYDERLERDVALKVLPAEAISDVAARTRLLREARTASKLNHPNVCTVHEVGEDNGRTYIAMECVEGRPLSHVISEQSLPVASVLRLGAQIADALAHAHERQVVHRDLKSANVVVAGDGRAKVLDFGLARHMTGASVTEATCSAATLTQPGVLVGTLAYMAPEQLRGEPADQRSDIWALGVVLYEAATGTRPFGGATPFELSSAILSQAPSLPVSMPEGLKAIVERCLQKDAVRRYQQAREVRSALEVLERGESSPGVKGRSQGGATHRRWLTVGAMFLLIVLGMLRFDVSRLTSWLAGAPRIESLAVLPLENLSGDPEQAYIADGVHEALITDLSHLDRLRRVIGRRSTMPMGGMQALEWAVTFPGRVGALAPIAVSASHSAWCVALSEAQRQAIASDPRWRDGEYSPDAPPDAGLAAARMIAMCTYRSHASFEQRFGRAHADGAFAVERYLHHHGRMLVARFAANTYVTLTRAMDSHDVGRGRGGWQQALARTPTPALVIAIDSDVLYPPAEEAAIAAHLPGARLETLRSSHGHDAFLLEGPPLNEMLCRFRRDVADERHGGARASSGGLAPVAGVEVECIAVARP